MLVAAYQRRQQAEVIKVQALITAMVNPDKAFDAYMNYMQMVLPEYTHIRGRLDDKLMEQFKPFIGKKFRFMRGVHGVSVVEEDDENAELRR